MNVRVVLLAVFGGIIVKENIFVIRSRIRAMRFHFFVAPFCLLFNSSLHFVDIIIPTGSIEDAIAPAWATLFVAGVEHSNLADIVLVSGKKADGSLLPTVLECFASLNLLE